MLAQNVGANAVIMAAPLNEVNSLAAFDMKGVNIPVFMIDQSNAELLGQALSDNFVLLSPTLILLQQDTNNWQQQVSGANFIVFQVFILTSYGFIFLLALRGLTLQIHHDGPSLNPAQTILIVSLAALILLIL